MQEVWGPVHTYPNIFESATFSFRVRLPSTRIRWIRRTQPQLFKSAFQSENFWIRYESGIVWTLNPHIFHPVTSQDKPSSLPWILVSLRNGTAGRRGRQIACAWRTWQGYNLRVLSWSWLTSMFSGLLQKDLFKRQWSLAKSYFKQNYCHVCHTRFAVFFPVPSCCVSSLVFKTATSTHALLPIFSEESWVLERIKIRVDGQIRFEYGYVWTWKFFNPKRTSCGFKNIRIRVEGPEIYSLWIFSPAPSCSKLG